MGHRAAGAEPLMIDDVATTGGSILKAIQGMSSDRRRFDVHRALVVVDREEGAAENLSRQGIKLRRSLRKVAIFRKFYSRWEPCMADDAYWG